MENTAYLSNKNEYTVFDYSDLSIRFRTSTALERYTKVIEWDNGYLVVMAKYKGQPEVEEYIDLVPILENLYFEPSEFLKPIKKVGIRYVQ